MAIKTNKEVEKRDLESDGGRGEEGVEMEVDCERGVRRSCWLKHRPLGAAVTGPIRPLSARLAVLQLPPQPL